MKRWDSEAGKERERPDIDVFIEDILALYKKYGMSIAHEDGHGSFIIEGDKESNQKWLQNANIGDGL